MRPSWTRTGMLAAAALTASAAGAEVTRIAITSTQPYGIFAGGKFVRIEGEAHGVLSPTEAIPGLDKAPRNAAGLVEYRTPITLIVPDPPTSGNGTLLVDVPNRGRAISLGLYNSPRGRPVATGSLDQGTGFLQDRGYAVAVVQWEMGEGPAIPSFVDAARGKLYAEGVGFAAVRDVALFLRGSNAPENPLANTVERAYVVGYSQTARFVKSFLVNGFNEHEGRTAFDGLHIVNAAAGVIPLLDTGPGPGSVAWETPGHPNPEMRGVHEEPFTWADAMKVATQKYRKLPLVVVNNTYNDYMGGRASLTRTGLHAPSEVPLPANVRVYDIAGAAHTMSRERNKECAEGQGQLDWSPALRAQLVVLDDWVRGRRPPPESRLFVVEARASDPEAFQAPAYLQGAKTLFPTLDADHNPASGVLLPDIAVPIASFGYMNSPLANMACRQAGTYRPFARTAAERRDTNDARLSLEERYPGGVNEYVTRVRVAARGLVADRLLLEDDAAVIINAAAENPAFAPTKPRARGATPPPAR